MLSEDRVKIFESESIPRAIAALSIPTVLSSLVTILYSLADTYFVGMLNNSVQNSAVTLSAPVLLAFNAVNNLFGVGSSSMMSRALGRKDYETARRSSAFGFYCSIFFGVLFSISCTVFFEPLLNIIGADATTKDATAAYLFWTVSLGAAPAILNVVMAYMVRAEGSAIHASIGTMSGCLLNIILDPIFVLPWGLDMGAEGAGLATFISNCVAVLYFIILILYRRKSTFVSINPKYFGFRKIIVLGVCAVGIPASIQNLLNVTGMTILNNFTSVYGSDAIAAMGIAQRINTVPTNIALGFSQGIMPLVSYNWASGNMKRMKDAIFFALRIILLSMLSVSVIFYIGAPLFVSLFMKNEIIVDYGTRFLRGFCLGIPLLTIDFLAVGVFQAVGMGSKSFMFAILRKLILEIPLIFLLNHLFPLYGLAYCQFGSEVVMSCLAIITLRSIIRKGSAVSRKRG